MEAIYQRIEVMIFFLAVVLGGVSCGVSDDSWETVETDGGAYRVSYEIASDGFPLNEHCSIAVNVEPISGDASFESVSIEVDADMPSHGHGINTLPEVSETAPGVYEVDGLLFHMPGEWELYVDVINGAVRERATFPFVLE